MQINKTTKTALTAGWLEFNSIFNIMRLYHA